MSWRGDRSGEARLTDELVNRILRYPSSARSRLRIAWLRLLGARIGRRCRFMAIEVPRNPWDMDIADGVALDSGVILLSTGLRNSSPRIKIGEHVYVNRHTMFDASCSIKIGANVMIGPYCYITDHDHEANDNNSLRTQGFIEEPVSIGPNTWLGAGAIVLKGVSIGEGVVVGAGSVVTKSIPSGARVAGSPARLLASETGPSS